MVPQVRSTPKPTTDNSYMNKLRKFVTTTERDCLLLRADPKRDTPIAAAVWHRFDERCKSLSRQDQRFVNILLWSDAAGLTEDWELTEILALASPDDSPALIRAAFYLAETATTPKTPIWAFDLLAVEIGGTVRDVPVGTGPDADGGYEDILRHAVYQLVARILSGRV